MSENEVAHSWLIRRVKSFHRTKSPMRRSASPVPDADRVSVDGVDGQEILLGGSVIGQKF